MVKQIGYPVSPRITGRWGIVWYAPRCVCGYCAAEGPHTGILISHIAVHRRHSMLLTILSHGTCPRLCRHARTGLVERPDLDGAFLLIESTTIQHTGRRPAPASPWMTPGSKLRREQTEVARLSVEQLVIYTQFWDQKAAIETAATVTAAMAPWLSSRWLMPAVEVTDRTSNTAPHVEHCTARAGKCLGQIYRTHAGYSKRGVALGPGVEVDRGRFTCHAKKPHKFPPDSIRTRARRLWPHKSPVLSYY
jgi:hypothetical protein